MPAGSAEADRLSSGPSERDQVEEGPPLASPEQEGGRLRPRVAFGDTAHGACARRPNACKAGMAPNSGQSNQTLRMTVVGPTTVICPVRRLVDPRPSKPVSRVTLKSQPTQTVAALSVTLLLNFGPFPTLQPSPDTTFQGPRALPDGLDTQLQVPVPHAPVKRSR